jgi:hypothetical protein
MLKATWTLEDEQKAIHDLARKAEQADGVNSSSQQHARDVQVGGDHYRSHGHMQPWDIIEEYYGQEALRAFLKGSVIKYMLRDKHPNVDKRKALHCLQKLIELED